VSAQGQIYFTCYDDDYVDDGNDDGKVDDNNNNNNNNNTGSGQLSSKNYVTYCNSNEMSGLAEFRTGIWKLKRLRGWAGGLRPLCRAEEKAIHVILKCSEAQKMHSTIFGKEISSVYKNKQQTSNWFIEKTELRNLGIFSYEVRYNLEIYLKKKMGGKGDDIKFMQILGQINTGVESEIEC